MRSLNWTILRRVSASTISQLSAIVGPGHVKVGEDAQPYCEEPTRKFGYQHYDRVVVVSPANAEEVSAVIALLHDRRIPFLPRSGGTGLVGASVPRDGVLVVLSLKRLQQVHDTGDGTITFGAGWRLGDIHAYVAKHYPGRVFGVDFAEQNACIGGMVATNAGGEQVVLFGMTADQLLDLEYALVDGAIVRMRHLDKSNDGLHLDRLLAGSEGTLAVITAVRVRLHRRLPRRAVVALALPSVESAADIAAWLKVKDFGPDVRIRSVEFMRKPSVTFACKYIDKHDPFRTYEYDSCLLVEIAGVSDLTDIAMDLVQGLIESSLIDEGMVEEGILFGFDEARCSELWEPRQNLPSSLNRQGPIKFDVSFPDAAAYWRFVLAVVGRVSGINPEAVCHMFGHIADGTVHLNILGIRDDEWAAVSEAVLALVALLNGSISSEHGVGTKLTPYTKYVHSPAELWTMLRIKRAFDPRNLLNPGAVVPRSYAAAWRLWGLP